MPMWVKLWPSKFHINPFFQPFRNEMLQPLGFVVYLLNGIVEHFVQKRLKQPVMTNNLQRTLTPGSRKTRSNRRRLPRPMLSIRYWPEQRPRNNKPPQGTPRTACLWAACRGSPAL